MDLKVPQNHVGSLSVLDIHTLIPPPNFLWDTTGAFHWLMGYIVVGGVLEDRATVPDGDKLRLSARILITLCLRETENLPASAYTKFGLQ